MASKSNIALSPLALAGLTLICGLSVANVYFNQALLPVFADTMSVSIAEVSWVATASQLGYALGMLLIVPLGDSFNPYRLCRILLFWTALMLGLSSVAESLASLAAVSVLICIGTCIPQVLLPYIALLSPPEKRSRNISLLQTGLVAGILLSRSLASLLSEHWGWQAVYRCACVGMLVSAAILPCLLQVRRKAGSSQSYVHLMSSMIYLFRSEPLLRLSCMLGASVFAAFSAFWSIIAFKLQAAPLNMSNSDIGIFSFWGGLAGLITPATGRLCDRFGTVTMSILSLLLSFLAFLLLLGYPEKFGLLLGANLLCFSLQLGQVSNQSRIFNLLNPENHSRLNTVYMVCNFCGGALGSAIGGVLWQQYHWNGPILFGLSTSMLAAILLFGMLHLHSKKRQNN